MKLDTIYNMDYVKGLDLVDDGSVDLVVTDPPYWHKKSPSSHIRRQCKTNSSFANSGLFRYDGVLRGELSDFDDTQIYGLLDALKPKLKIYNGYFFCSESQVPYYCLWAERNGLMFSVLVWEKPVSIINKNRFSQNLEYIVRVYDYGTALNRLDDNDLYNRVCHCEVVQGKEKRHPTQKPVEAMARFIKLSSKEGDVVLDPFLGSGTSAVACSRLGRHYIGFEVNGDYFRTCQARLEEEVQDRTRSIFDGAVPGVPSGAPDRGTGISDEEFD